MSDERRAWARSGTFPIQGGWNAEGHFRIEPSTVSWKMAEQAFITYTRFFGWQQSLDTLAQRGGFGREEFMVLYAGLHPMRPESWDWVRTVPGIMANATLVIPARLPHDGPGVVVYEGEQRG